MISFTERCLFSAQEREAKFWITLYMCFIFPLNLIGQDWLSMVKIGFLYISFIPTSSNKYQLFCLDFVIQRSSSCWNESFAKYVLQEPSCGFHHFRRRHYNNSVTSLPIRHWCWYEILVSMIQISLHSYDLVTRNFIRSSIYAKIPLAF